MAATIQHYLQAKSDAVAYLNPVCASGAVTAVVGLLIESQGPPVSHGDFCEIQAAGGQIIRTQVAGFRNGRVLSMPLDEVDGLELGCPIIARSAASRAPVGPALLGRVIDGFGEPLDGLGPLRADEHFDIYRAAPGPMDREPISEPLSTGVKVIDGLITCGKGQRIGIFGGSGVGKSTLLGAMARHGAAGVNVIALIGERNREVRGFIEHEIGPEALQRSVVIVATSDRPAPVRVRATFLAATVADYFRERGEDVLLIMDSVTRFAMAQREIGLASGEPPSQKGYTPSVFQLLPRVFERAGKFRTGSVTAFLTVLVEGDDMNEPIADAVRSLLDGHIVLSRDLAAANQYPAIDVLESISRLARHVASSAHMECAAKLRDALAAYRRSEDLINLGAYTSGSDAKLDNAIRLRSEILDFLKQDLGEHSALDATVGQLEALSKKL